MQVSHTDNTCTVGETCICGRISPNEMRELLKICPEGSFTPTFYNQNPLRRPEDFEEYFASYEYAHPDDDGEFRAGMYFYFKRDEAGEELLNKFIPKNDIKPRGWFFKKHYNIIKD